MPPGGVATAGRNCRGWWPRSSNTSGERGGHPVPAERCQVEPDPRWGEVLEVEREVVAGDAEITPTRHGSGLGLWLVKWTVENIGGEVAFETSDLGGNAVRLRLPR